MYSIENKKDAPNNINYPIYFPDVFLKLGGSFLEKINSFFSYKVIILIPNKDNIDEIKGIIESKECPIFKHKLYYNDCFNLEDNYKVTFIRVCHICNKIFILTGRYSTKFRYKHALKFSSEFNKKVK